MEKKYIDLFVENRQLIDHNSATIINDHREDAFEKFQQYGFPTQKLEEYKYIDIRQPLVNNYDINFKAVNISKTKEELYLCKIPEIDAYLYYFQNERFIIPKENLETKLPTGVIICNLKQACQHHPELVAKHYGKLSNKEQDGLVAFNSMYAQDGLFLYVPKGVEIEKPIQIIQVLDAEVDLMTNTHNLIILEEGAKAQILVCEHTKNNLKYFHNRVTEVFVKDNATYEHYNLENSSRNMTNLSTLLVQQTEKSNVQTSMITLHNGITRNTIKVAIDGEHCQTEVGGLVLANKKQQVDNFTAIFHNKPNCQSNELYKYILDDESKCGFTGKLYVAKDAQKTQAFQTDKNLLLSKKARMRTKPQLEIYADDVKCSHGATIGQLDEKALFYMRTRGLSEKTAKHFLKYAFTADVLDNIRIEALHERMEQLIFDRLQGKLKSNGSCALCNEEPTL